MLRLSQSHENGLVLSYKDASYSRQVRIRNILLIRQGANRYVTKTNHNSTQSSSLPQLIRAFVKLQFVYTPTQIYKKNHVF